MTEIEIRDPDPEEGPSTEAEPSRDPAAEEEGPESPYRNLLVPLAVVPAVIVMVLVGIVALFGAIAGEPPSPEENIERLLNGGRNERDQAAFGLMRQVLDEVGANAEGGTLAWEVSPPLRDAIQKAWEDTNQGELEEDDVPTALALTVLVAKFGDPAGVARLAELTRLSEVVDPAGEARFQAAAVLGGLNADGGLSAGQAKVAREALLDLLDGQDAGLRQAAAIGLQTLPGEDTASALRGALSASSVQLRLQAALSLAELGDDAGEAVLLEMLERDPYEAERERDRKKWSKESRISESRLQALRGLTALDKAPPRATLERLVAEDDDLKLRERLLELLQSQG